MAGRHGGLPLHVGGIIPQEGWFYGGEGVLLWWWSIALQGIDSPLYRGKEQCFADHPFTLRASDAKKHPKMCGLVKKICIFVP